MLVGDHLLLFLKGKWKKRKVALRLDQITEDTYVVISFMKFSLRIVIPLSQFIEELQAKSILLVIALYFITAYA